MSASRINNHRHEGKQERWCNHAIADANSRVVGTLTANVVHIVFIVTGVWPLSTLYNLGPVILPFLPLTLHECANLQRQLHLSNKDRLDCKSFKSWVSMQCWCEGRFCCRCKLSWHCVVHLRDLQDMQQSMLSLACIMLYMWPDTCLPIKLHAKTVKMPALCKCKAKLTLK